jgi:nitrilase
MTRVAVVQAASVPFDSAATAKAEDLIADFDDAVQLDGPEVGRLVSAPNGTVLAGPVFDDEVILYAEVDLAEIARGHLDMDAVGHYSRPDVFESRVDTRRRLPVVFSDGGSPLHSAANTGEGDER